MHHLSTIKNKALLNSLEHEYYALADYKINAKIHPVSLVEDIAIGQSLGAWETNYVRESVLAKKVAKVISLNSNSDFHTTTIAFPYDLWHGNLSSLLTLLYGKMSFYDGVQLNSVWFTKNCFSHEKLIGPQNDIHKIRKLTSAPNQSPLLMGILKPNVAMDSQTILDLYCLAAESGIHLLKDDEIRHDFKFNDILERVQKIANESKKRNFKTLYAVHLHPTEIPICEAAQILENEGAHAFLFNTWIYGLNTLQKLRKATKLPIISHPAMVGAFGTQINSSTIHPRVTLGHLIRAAGADMSLFPSPYGQLGFKKQIALDIAHACQNLADCWPISQTVPVPSAGIKPEHAPTAIKDFGTDFILNAGTGIFTDKNGIRSCIQKFLSSMGS